MEGLPVRGARVRALGLALPPERMPRLHRGRPLKRWRYVGIYGPELQACAGDALIGGLPMRWWAVAEPGRPLAERTAVGRRRRAGFRLEDERVLVEDGSVRLELALEPNGEPVEVASPSGRSYIWTRKQPVRARGLAELHGRTVAVDCSGLVDESAGYHERRTEWRWSAGVGRTDGREQIAWNLVAGVHDGERASERTVWVDGEPAEVGPVELAADLSRVGFAEGGELRFSEWCAREDRTNVLLLRSVYRQPFGTFEGELPGGLRLVEGHGVMEEHEARW